MDGRLQRVREGQRAVDEWAKGRERLGGVNGLRRDRFEQGDERGV
ncbi:hypothetical protein [Candidatus Chloroploca mongolica]|nr:hypothetical protein [Candidatus Chloroploca mongolica]